MPANCRLARMPQAQQKTTKPVAFPRTGFVYQKEFGTL